MKLPFFYPEHPEFKEYVDDVAWEMLDFASCVESSDDPPKYIEMKALDRAKDIVIHITSHEPTWWERLLSRLRGEQSVDMFEAGLEKWLRESIERAEPKPFFSLIGKSSDYTDGYHRGVKDTTANLLRELGLNDAREEQS